ncbi:MAG: 50S ribosomal protein L25/general stress protein Ctc [Gammaproteobacteria bacterium]|nr:50S ribosomal protein L25/general stress protein Ctc [Gammaproteobacteria bacterium]MDH5735574.1 50S ribosomal protein L25/general stress protein Ctc [Gammaproteobacteria bacterium]
MSIELNAELRTDMGKGASRRLRHAEKMPAIVYGAGKDPVNLTLLQKDVRAVVDDEAFYSSVLDLNIAGKKEQVILRDIQHHPYKVDMMHMDFQRVDKTSKMHIHVPLHFIGEEKSPGVKTQGGLVSHMMVEIEVECLAKDIPEFIEVDMSAMNSGDILHLSDIKLPKGVEIMILKQGADHDTAVCSIHPPKGGVVETEEGAEGGEE